MIKNTILILLALFIVAIFTIEPFAIAIGNHFSKLHRNGYFIPKESAIYKFQETKANQGSGEYWLYGKDNHYFYTTSLQGNGSGYSFISRSDAEKIQNFDEVNYKTWQLDKYAWWNEVVQQLFYCKRPKNLYFKERMVFIDMPKPLKRPDETYTSQELLANCAFEQYKYLWEKLVPYSFYEDDVFMRINYKINQKPESYNIIFEFKKNNGDYYLAAIYPIP